MKKIKIILIITALFVATNMFAQAPPPPPNHGSSGNQPGGNAPIASGLFILLGLGAAYGGKKIYDINKENMEE